MRKILLGILATLAMSTSVFAVDVIVDSEPLVVDVPAQIVEGRTLVPLRAIFEELGATIEWDGTTQKITAIKDETTIELTVNDKTAYVNGEEIILDVPATIVDSRTLVPVRFVSESLDCNVFWIAETQTVRIASELYDVVRVVDGDTLIINFNDVEERVRLIGINTPESVHSDESKNTPEGTLASDYTKSLAEGKQVELEFDEELRDQYDRMLAYVYIDGVMLNKTLLLNNYAEIATYPPNVKYLDDFNAIKGIEEVETTLNIIE